MRGRRSADGDPQVAVHAGESLRDAPDHHRADGRLTGLDPRERPVRFVRHPHDPVHDRDPRGAVPDRDRVHDRVRVGVDPRDGVVEGVHDPHGVRAHGQRPRPVAHADRASPRPSEGRPARPCSTRPAPPTRCRTRPRSPADQARPGSSTTSRHVGVDARDRPVEPVGHPNASLADRDARWAVPDRDRVDDLIRVGADPRDGGPAALHDPYGANPTAIPVGFSPTGIESRTSCSLGSIRVTVPASGLVTHTASCRRSDRPGRSSNPSGVPRSSPVSGSSTPTEFDAITVEAEPRESRSGIAIAAARSVVSAAITRLRRPRARLVGTAEAE